LAGPGTGLVLKRVMLGLSTACPDSGPSTARVSCRASSSPLSTVSCRVRVGPNPCRALGYPLGPTRLDMYSYYGSCSLKPEAFSSSPRISWALGRACANTCPGPGARSGLTSVFRAPCVPSRRDAWRRATCGSAPFIART
jgi:hypothetical protein